MARIGLILIGIGAFLNCSDFDQAHESLELYEETKTLRIVLAVVGLVLIAIGIFLIARE